MDYLKGRFDESANTSPSACNGRSESACAERQRCLPVSRDFIILLGSMLRRAAATLLWTAAEISSLCALPRLPFVRQSLRYPHQNRPISTSVGLRKKKQKSAWLLLAEGQTMDGNIEEILAPLRLAVKEQVI